MIRAATLQDMASITKIYAHEVLNGLSSWELTPPDETEMTRRYKALASKNYPYLVAEQADVITGYAYAGPFRMRPAYGWTVEDSVYVAADHAGQGVGTSLLAHLIHECESIGFRQMVAVIGDRDNIASIKLHEKSGFDHRTTLDGLGYKNDIWLDWVLMQCPLGEGAKTPPSSRNVLQS